MTRARRFAPGRRASVGPSAASNASPGRMLGEGHEGAVVQLQCGRVRKLPVVQKIRIGA